MSVWFGRLCLVLSLAMGVAGCGTGYVNGWRDDDQDSRSEEEKCSAREGYAWTGKSCDAIADMSLVGMTEAICRKRSGAAWLDERCQDIATLDQRQCERAATEADADAAWQPERKLCISTARAACMDRGPDFDLVEDRCEQAPSLTIQGERSQTVAVGQSMTPLKLSVSRGALARISKTTCPGYFALGADTLQTSSGAASVAGKKSCEVEVVAFVGDLVSRAVGVKVVFVPGFATVCREPGNQEAARTVDALLSAVEKATCDEGEKALMDLQGLDLSGNDIVDVSPLAGMAKLKSLKLNGNSRLVDLKSLANMPALVRLDISQTAVNDVSMFAKHKVLALLIADWTPLDQPMVTSTAVNKTETNCPTGTAVNRAVRNFCKAPKRS